MNKTTIQIQSVLYNNEKSALFRAMDSLARAIEISKLNGGWIEFAELKYGDASPSRIFSEHEIGELKEKYKFVFSFEYVFFGLNSGSAKGHNMLGETCKTEYMQIMNPDVIVSPRYFLEIFKPFEKEKEAVGMVEARQTPIEHPKEYDMVTGETSWATTGCAIFPTALFRELNGFDEKSFFMYCDDLDFSWRLRQINKKIIYQPSALVFHAKRLSAQAGWLPTAAEIYYSSEAALIMAHKWSNPKLVEKLLKHYQDSSNESLNKAAKAFLKKKDEKALPEPIDPDHEVADFVGDYYTEHRFIL